jgi:hypothetical protein
MDRRQIRSVQAAAEDNRMGAPFSAARQTVTRLFCVACLFNVIIRGAKIKGKAEDRTLL